MPRLSKKKLFSTIFIILIVVVVGGYFASQSFKAGDAESADADSLSADGDSTAVAESEEDEEKGPDPVPVEVSTVRPRAVSSYYYTTATLEPERKVDVLAKIAGEVTELQVEEGAVVREGAILCSIEDDEQRVALEEARINRELQERELERLKQMRDQNLISDTEFSDRQHQLDLAKNAYEAALMRYEYTKVRAPFAGIVTKRHIEIGQNLTVGHQLFELADVTPLLIRMYLPESEIGDIKIGQDVTISPDSDSERMLTGRIVRIAPEVDDRTGTIKVTAETNGAIRPGSFARIKIVTDTRRGSLAIPRRGLVSEAGDLYVFIAEADSVRKSPVRLGYQDEDYAEVVDGLAEGDSIVVVGMGGLRTGTKIRVLEPQMQKSLMQDDQSDSASASN